MLVDDATMSSANEKPVLEASEEPSNASEHNFLSESFPITAIEKGNKEGSNVITGNIMAPFLPR